MHALNIFMNGSRELSTNVISELLRNISLEALSKSNLTIGLDFAEISRMTKEIDRLCHRKVFEDKRRHKTVYCH